MAFMTPEREEKLQKARFLLAEINANRKALRALEVPARDLDGIAVIEKLEAKIADGVPLEEFEQIMLDDARENLAGTFRRVSYPVGIKPLLPMTPSQLQARAERDAADATIGLDGWVEALGLNARNEMLKAQGQPPISFELIEMQPPKKTGLVKLGFFATIVQSVRLWKEARKERKRQLALYKKSMKDLQAAIKAGVK